FLARRRPLEGEPRRAGVAQVPDMAVHSLLPGSARVHDDRVALRVRDRDDDPAPARPLLRVALRLTLRLLAALRLGTARVERRLEIVIDHRARPTRRIRRHEARRGDPRAPGPDADLCR